MIARIWRGWALRPTADDYQEHYEREVAAHLRALIRRDERVTHHEVAIDLGQ